jgi:hypothetical protein
MSFQLNTATALPAEVQLGKEKPQAAFCLRSRYSLSANTASSWSAGTTLSIPLQTGTPGTFTDVKLGIIQATLQLSNTNPYVDFLNFGPSGAMIFFDEMRIFSSGTPIEENLRYSETADLLTTQAGHQCKPFHVYRRNKWRARNGIAGKHHINFIKPSMVDSMGVPMFGRTPFMDKNSAVYEPPSISFGSNVASGQPFGRTALEATNGDPLGNLAPLLGSEHGFCDDAWFEDLVSNANSYSGADGTSRQRNPLNLSHRQNVYSSFNFSRNTSMARRTNTADLAHATAAMYTPAQWPDFQPSTLMGEFDDDEIDRIEGKAKVSEYIKYLCNVRSLPIGVKGNVPASGYQATAQPLSAPALNQSDATDQSIRFLQYRVSMPFLSGIYGIFADKMFPDMLIGANNIRIEFKLAQNAKALWTTMDPCRRVPGTLRDYIPYTGSASGAQRNPVVAGEAWASALGSRRVRVVPFEGTDSSVIVGTEVFNEDSLMGIDFQPSSMSYNYTTQCPTNAGVIVVPSFTHIEAEYGFTESVSGLPKPQYVPAAAPWNKGIAPANGILVNSGVDVTYINERQSCFGTYLPASQPQSRRCWPNTKLEAVGDSYANAGNTFFTIRDIQYIGEQVQLDDVVTSAIIQSAATSEIVVWTRGYRSFEASCDQNTQQNIILPIQIGQAEALYLLFRPTIVTQSVDYYSNSFYCPFVGLSYSNSGQTIPLISGKNPDVGGVYRLESSLDTSGQGAFSYQLFSGTKQYPLQPIQTVSELISEREKSVHSLHNWEYCSTESMALNFWSKRFGNATSTMGLDFDPFIDLGYFTTFVPVFALDDQTITQNPYFQIAELPEAAGSNTSSARIRGYRCPATSEIIQSNAGSTFQGVLNEFMSPIGTFYLGWDFESWTNHQDVMRSGKFLGQEQISVRMTGTYLCSAQNILAYGQAPQSQTTMCTAIVPHCVKLSFIPGGHLLSYY